MKSIVLLLGVFSSAMAFAKEDPIKLQKHIQNAQTILSANLASFRNARQISAIKLEELKFPTENVWLTGEIRFSILTKRGESHQVKCFFSNEGYGDQSETKLYLCQSPSIFFADRKLKGAINSVESLSDF